MKVSIGISGTVGGDEQLGAVKIRGVYRYQFDLYRPLRELAVHCGGIPRGGSGDARDTLGLGAGAAAGERSADGLGLLGGTDRLGIIGGGLPHLKADGTHRAGGEAIAQAVAIVLTQKAGPPVHHADGALMTGGGAETAAVTAFNVDFDDFSLHVLFHPFRSGF